MKTQINAQPRCQSSHPSNVKSVRPVVMITIWALPKPGKMELVGTKPPHRSRIIRQFQYDWPEKTKKFHSSPSTPAWTFSSKRWRFAPPEECQRVGARTRSTHPGPGFLGVISLSRPLRPAVKTISAIDCRGTGKRPRSRSPPTPSRRITRCYLLIVQSMKVLCSHHRRFQSTNMARTLNTRSIPICTANLRWP